MVLESEDTVAPEQWRHNWLYSVLPITNYRKDFKPPPHDGLYLTGYCKTCQQVFSVKIPHDSADALTVVTQLDIPRWGCASPAFMANANAGV